MDDSIKQRTSDDRSKGEILLASAELEKRRYETKRQLEHLRREHRNLESAKRSLTDDVREAEKSVSSVRQEVEQLDAEINSLTTTGAELENNIEKYELAISALKRFCTEYAQVDGQLLRQILLAEISISSRLHSIHDVFDQLETNRSRLERLKQKISSTKWFIE
jgi:chromosome segregation ATPase